LLPVVWLTQFSKAKHKLELTRLWLPKELTDLL